MDHYTKERFQSEESIGFFINKARNLLIAELDNALKGQWTTAWNLVSAGSILAALPSVAMFFAMQKHFVAGLTFGATKG